VTTTGRAGTSVRSGTPPELAAHARDMKPSKVKKALVSALPTTSLAPQEGKSSSSRATNQSDGRSGGCATITDPKR
jgi:hypothetical protein